MKICKDPVEAARIEAFARGAVVANPSKYPEVQRAGIKAQRNWADSQPELFESLTAAAVMSYRKQAGRKDFAK